MRAHWSITAERPASHYVDRLTPDYDPWEGYEWPDRSGQLERARRKKVADDGKQSS
jgi:hypothetical protein